MSRIHALLREAGVVSAGQVNWFEQIGSTNSWLAKQADIHGKVCLAELQTAGRGRRGRAWRAPRSSSVLLSIGWHLDGVDASGLSLVSGLAAVDGLRRVGVESVGLKWPNDLLADGKKLGGALIELRRGRCIIGMGINVNMPSPAPDPIGQPWADLKSLGHDIDRDLLAAYLIVAHCRCLTRFREHGFAPFVEQWNRLNAHRGRSVSVALAGESFSGIVEGIDQRGALVINQDGARRRIISGEASIRLRSCQTAPP